MFKIKAATKQDLKACEKLGKFKEFREASGDYIDAKFLANYLDKDFFLVVKKNKELVGYLVAEKLKGRGAVIWYLAIKPKYRDKGLGGKILNEFENRLRKQNTEWIILSALENKKTLKFYKKHGYSRGIKEVEFIKLLNKKSFKDMEF